MKRVIIVGSPRSNGRSAHLAEMLFEANIDERPEDELYLVPVSEVEIGPCIGCNACRKESAVTLKDDEGVEVTVMRHRCIFDDDMQTLYDLIDEADELTVVSPIYFSGAPASMKCVLDRLQPYFWVTQAKGRELAGADERREQAESRCAIDEEYDRRLAGRRPATLHVVGEGGDPHGFLPLVSEMRSALACAGFRLAHVFDWVGKIDHAGEIVAEATEVDLPDHGVMGDAPEHEIGDSAFDAIPDSRTVGTGSDRRVANAGRPKPKLDLSGKPRNAQSKSNTSGKGGNRKSGGQNKAGKSGNAGKSRGAGRGGRRG